MPEPLPHPDCLLFDLDGTLVDSVPDLAWAVDATMRELGLLERGREKVAIWVGNGMDSLLHRALCNDMAGQAEAGLHARAKALFNAFYGKHFCVDSRLYHGALPCLEALKAAGMPCAVVTNKPIAFTRQILDSLGLAPFMQAVLGGDSLTVRKPDPAPLLEAQRLLGGQHAWMVGDSSNDVQAARNAGMPVVCTSYGYNHGHDIREANPDRVVDSLAELPAMLGS